MTRRHLQPILPGILDAAVWNIERTPPVCAKNFRRIRRFTRAIFGGAARSHLALRQIENAGALAALCRFQQCSAASLFHVVAVRGNGKDVERSEGMSVKVPLFEHHILAHDQPVRRHFLQRGQYAAHMLIGIDEDDDHGQLAAGFNHVSGLHAVSSQESGNSMKRRARINVFFPQIVQNLHDAAAGDAIGRLRSDRL